MDDYDLNWGASETGSRARSAYGGSEGGAAARLSHEQWLQRKERDRLQETRAQGAKRSRRVREQKKEQSKQSFERWLSNKDLRERAVDLLSRLDVARAADEAQWFETAVALAAVDTALGVGTIETCDCAGICQDRSHRITRQAERCPCPLRKCLECNRCVGGEGDANCCVVYGDNGAPLKPTQRDPTKRPCSCPTRSTAEEWINWTMLNHMFSDVEVTRAERAEMTELTQAAMAPVADDETKFVLPSLQFMFASKPKKKPDFVVPNPKSVRKFEEAKAARPLTRDQKLLNSLFLKQCRREWRRARRAMLQKLGQYLEDQDANDQRLREEREKEEKLQGRSLSSAEPKQLSGDALVRRTARRERAGLMSLGVRKMAAWIEADIETEEERVADERRRAEDDNRANFDARATRDKRRGKAAASSAPEQAVAKPRFDFGRGAPAVRPNPELKPARARRPEEKSDAAEASYNAWLAQKLTREKAQGMLSFVDAPTEVSDDPGEQEEYWREVGQVVKAVDRALLKPFAEWSGSFHTPGYCQRLWDTWAPVSCDVHSPTSSVVRDTFIKLLHRRGQANFEAAFDNVMNKKLRQLERKSDDFRGDDADEFIANFSLGRPEFRRLLQQELGITLQDDEARRLIDCFDANMDGQVSRREFLDFMGQAGDPASILTGRCLWQTSCYECGMQNAFTVGVLRHDHVEDEEAERNGARAAKIVTLGNGERRRITELPDHRWLCRREGHAAAPRQTCNACALAVEQGERHSGSETRNGERTWCAGSDPPSKCAAARWTREKQDRALDKLRRLSKGNREIKRVQDMMQNGEPPAAPKLKLLDLVEDGREELKCNSLYLRWRPESDSLVSFFLLETSGPVGSKTQRAHTFAEICKDPPNADSQPRMSFLVTGLQPNTSYSFRIRALNGYGPGAYTHATFTTYPAPPPKPSVLRVSASSAYLHWRRPTDEGAKQLKRLRALFADCDKDGSGGVSRDEFLAEIDAHPEMLEFLQQTPVRGADATTASQTSAGLSVFDAIEADDDEEITWPEFLSFFQIAQAKAQTRRGSRARRSGAEPEASAVLQLGATAGAGAGANDRIGNTTYVLQRCTDDNRGEFTSIFKGSAPEYNVTGLEAGSSAKFRALCINCDGKESDPGETVVVNTMLPTPSAPRLQSRGQVVATTFARLCWDAADPGASKRNNAAASVASVLSEWAATDADARGLADGADGGLSIQKAFRTYDADDSGYIDGQELENLLRDLGVNPTEERLREAWATFDTDDDQRVSFDEFAAWWVAQEVFYVLRRDHGMYVDQATATGLNLQDPPVTSPFDIQCHRGPIPKCEVAGLEPNTLYQFRLRVVSPRSQSSFSRSLALVTAPSIPGDPVAVAVKDTTIQVKWYPGLGGASRYVLQAQFVDALSDADHARAMRSGSRSFTASEFTTVYEGPECVTTVDNLAPNCVYRFRVAGVNAMRMSGEYSEMLQANTTTDVEVPRPANAGDMFTVECTGDVVVGDTILFTERLCMGPDGKLLEANVAFDSGPLALGASGTPRLNVSVSSIDSLATPAGGEFVGERTIAATVLKEQYVSSSTRGRRPRRALALEVVWSTVSRKSAEPYIVRAGQKITRKASKLFAFETFRMRWQNEERRKSAEEEAAHLARMTRREQ